MTVDVTQLSYEQARDELLTVVRTLETGAATLEESMSLWERGEALAARCQGWLDGARERLEKAHQSDPVEEPGEAAEPSVAPATTAQATTTGEDA